MILDKLLGFVAHVFHLSPLYLLGTVFAEKAC
jgi:hypothetical protein